MANPAKGRGPAKERGPSAGTEVLRIGMELFKLYTDQEGTIAYASVKVGDHEENYPVVSRPIKRRLAREVSRQLNKAAAQDAMGAAILTLEGFAFDGARYLVALRVAEFGGNIFIDLGDESWHQVKCAPQGWEIPRKALERLAQVHDGPEHAGK
jgi:hypothetical protein